MDLEERIRLACGDTKELARVLHDRSQEVLLALLDNPGLSEDQVLILLSRRDLPQQVIRRLAGREDLLRGYRVKLAVVRHPHSPRSLSLPLLRHLYLADLMKVVATPGVPADLRRVAEDAVTGRAPTLSLGERIAMARQGAGRIAGTLLLDKEKQVFETALNNPRLTEELVLKALAQENISAEAVEKTATHPRWAVVYSVRLALLRHPLTSLGRVLSISEQVKKRDLQEIVHDPRMPANRRDYLAKLASSQWRPRAPEP